MTIPQTVQPAVSRAGRAAGAALICLATAAPPAHAHGLDDDERLGPVGILAFLATCAWLAFLIRRAARSAGRRRETGGSLLPRWITLLERVPLPRRRPRPVKPAPGASRQVRRACDRRATPRPARSGSRIPNQQPETTQKGTAR